MTNSLVSRTDPSYTSAAFGLARCLCATGDRKGAVAALERVPQTSNLFTRSRVEVARTLINTERSAPGAKELKDASAAIEAIALEGMDRYRLTKQVLETALHLVTSQALSPASSIAILGQPLEELYLRKGLEKSLRAMAHLTSGDEKIRLVDERNAYVLVVCDGVSSSQEPDLAAKAAAEGACMALTTAGQQNDT